MSDLDPKFTFTGTNPLILVKPPAPLTASSTAYSNFNAICVNLAMFAPRISISFTESGGLTTNPFDLTQSTTIWSKLMYLFQVNKDKKRLYVVHATNYLYCQIETYRVTSDAGQKDILNHTIELVLLSSVSQ
jgi:hypothetical protein